MQTFIVLEFRKKANASIEAFEELVKLLDDDKLSFNPDLLEAIGDIGKEKAVDILVKQYKVASRSYNDYCVGYSDADDLPQALELMNDRQRPIRNILKKIGTPEALDFIKKVTERN